MSGGLERSGDAAVLGGFGGSGRRDETAVMGAEGWSILRRRILDSMGGSLEIATKTQILFKFGVSSFNVVLFAVRKNRSYVLCIIHKF